MPRSLLRLGLVGRATNVWHRDGVLPRWLYERVLRALQRAQPRIEGAQREELAERLANALYPHLVDVVRKGLPLEEYDPPERSRGRLRRLREPADGAPSPSHTSCRFVGTSAEPGRGVLRGVGLYQFDTADGVPVSLHDTDCIGLDYTPGPHPTLTAKFRYDPDWTPPVLAARPVVVIRFLGAHILAWETDLDEADTYENPNAVGGQVSNLDWDGHRLFTLDLLTVRVDVTAHTVEVSTEPFTE